MNFRKLDMLLRESDDCIKFALLGDPDPVKQLIAILAFELGKASGEIESLKKQIGTGSANLADNEDARPIAEIRSEAREALYRGKAAKRIS